MDDGTPRKAALYTRISNDDEGLALGVARQREDCEALAVKLGWKVVDVFTDNDISASTLSKKRRPGFERMLVGVEAGVYDAIISYSNSRLTRRPLELEQIIALHDKTGVLISTVVSGTDDLSTADGRMVARIKASVDAAEAERTSERVKRKQRALLADGLPHNPTARFGYVYTSEAGYVTVSKQAEILRWAYGAYARGVTMYAICKRWNELGFVTPGAGKLGGKPWRATGVADCLDSGFAAGFIAKGKRRHRTYHPGSHAPIIDMEMWAEYLDRRAENATEAPRIREARFELSGLLYCDCGSMMSAYTNRGKRRWRCTRAKNDNLTGHRMISNEKALEAVGTWIESIVTGGAGVVEEAQKIAEDRATVAADDDHWSRREVDLLAQKDRLVKAVAKGIMGDEDAEAEMAAIKSELATLAVQRAAVAKTARSAGKVTVAAFATLLEAWGRMTPNGRRRALAELVKRFVVTPDKILIPVQTWEESPEGDSTIAAASASAASANSSATIAQNLRTASSFVTSSPK